MKVLIFAPAGERLAQSIAQTIRQDKHAHELETYHDFELFHERLRRPLELPAIAILQADSPGMLQEFVRTKDLFQDLRIILMLPGDSTPATLARAHTLRPRYITCADTSLADVADVVKKMLRAPRPAAGQ